MPYLGVFGPESENTIAIFEIRGLELVKLKKFVRNDNA